MSGYKTNLASEFYVLAALYRLGADASLSLGNKKAVDITVVRPTGDVVTIDVKGVANKYDWPAGKLNPGVTGQHFLVLLSFEGKFASPSVAPSVWVVPHRDLMPFVKPYSGGMKVVSRSLMKKRGERYRDAWHLIVDLPAA